jgi:hypothetical protein
VHNSLPTRAFTIRRIVADKPEPTWIPSNCNHNCHHATVAVAVAVAVAAGYTGTTITGPTRLSDATRARSDT